MLSLIASWNMAQLLVRNVELKLVKKLKSRAALHGVSAEEEHRRILKEVLNRPVEEKPSLIDFLLDPEGVAPDEELQIQRRRELESHREVKF
jgi:plasmid stability protein